MTNASTLRMELELSVDHNGCSQQEVQRLLQAAIEHLYNEGLFTGDLNAELRSSPTVRFPAGIEDMEAVAETAVILATEYHLMPPEGNVLEAAEQVVMAAKRFHDEFDKLPEHVQENEYQERLSAWATQESTYESRNQNHPER